MQNLFEQFVNDFDYSQHSRRAYLSDLKKFQTWFESSNKESISLTRITLQDITGFRNHLQKVEKQAISSINRCLVTIRKFLSWANDQGLTANNPAKKVKEIKKQKSPPQFLGPSDVRKLLREAELRNDVRGLAIISMFVYTGCRVSDLATLDLDNITIKERSGTVKFIGKGNKYREVSLPLAARQAVSKYLEVRPNVSLPRLFIGERGALTDKGIRNLLKKYGRFVGVDLYCHLLRHTFSHQYLKDTGDIVSLSQVLGHQNLNTTRIYCERTKSQLDELSEKVSY